MAQVYAIIQQGYLMVSQILQHVHEILVPRMTAWSPCLTYNGVKWSHSITYNSMKPLSYVQQHEIMIVSRMANLYEMISCMTAWRNCLELLYLPVIVTSTVQCLEKNMSSWKYQTKTTQWLIIFLEFSISCTKNPTKVKS